MRRKVLNKLSNCCKSEIEAIDGYGGTSFLLCTKCNEECDILIAKQSICEKCNSKFEGDWYQTLCNTCWKLSGEPLPTHSFWVIVRETYGESIHRFTNRVAQEEFKLAAEEDGTYLSSGSSSL